MPFDRIPSYQLSLPEIHPYIAPPRPIHPIGPAIAEAVAKIADSLDPVKRAERSLAMAKLPIEREMINRQLQWMKDHPGQPLQAMNPMWSANYNKILAQTASANSAAAARNAKAATTPAVPPAAVLLDSLKKHGIPDSQHAVLAGPDPGAAAVQLPSGPGSANAAALIPDQSASSSENNRDIPQQVPDNPFATPPFSY